MIKINEYYVDIFDVCVSVGKIKVNLFINRYFKMSRRPASFRDDDERKMSSVD